MAIITLTTDLGLQDNYIGSVKGQLLKKCPDATIVDISHSIRPFDPFHAAFVIRNAFPDFPEHTIHIVNVEAEQHQELSGDKSEAGNFRFLLIRHHGQYFLGRDNGIFSMVFDQEPPETYELHVEDAKEKTFAARDVLVPIACRLATGVEPDRLGKPVNHIKTMNTLQPVLQENGGIRGFVVYIDRYENVMVNISRKFFEKQRDGRDYTISFKREHLDQLVFNYSDVPEGEKLAFFNSAGYLEIAMNKGKASSLLGLRMGDIVQIDFR